MHDDRDAAMNRRRWIGKRDWLILLCLALVLRLLTARSLTGPPYMDSYYYTVGARRLAEGYGLTEPFLWHYLDSPTDIPHPGFLYWMPLPSLLAAPFVALLGRSFLVAQLPFVLLSALLPVVSYSVAWQTTGLRRHAWVAGLLTLFSGFFFPFWTLPETFAPFAVFGSLALSLAGRGTREAGGRKQMVGLLIGLLVGLAHLTRADGILLLFVVALGPLLSSQSRNMQHATRNAQHTLRLLICHLPFVISGYLLVMGPWFIRNLGVIGAPLSSAGMKTLWLTTYDDLFCYGCDLSPCSYLAWGWGNILHAKLFALWANFQRFLAEDCLVFLLPFVLIGLCRLRRRPPFILSTIYLFLLYLAHSLAFTFPGWRGGFFHSSGALLPFLYAAAMDGLDAAVRWAARRRQGWNVRRARAVFTAGSVVLAILLSLYVSLDKLPVWGDAGQIYQEVGTWLTRQDVPNSAIVMVGNPPGFWYHIRRPAVVVPNGDVEMLLATADRYGVRYVVLDRNRPSPLAGLYVGETLHTRLQPVAAWAERGTILYAVRSEND